MIFSHEIMELVEGCKIQHSHTKDITPKMRRHKLRSCHCHRVTTRLQLINIIIIIIIIVIIIILARGTEAKKA